MVGVVIEYQILLIKELHSEYTVKHNKTILPLNYKYKKCSITYYLTSKSLIYYLTSLLKFAMY